jgi:hypothetical protein
VFEHALRLPLGESGRTLAMQQIQRFQDELAIERGK